jgi:hypothetical protein
MQEVVEAFFSNAVETNAFSMALFPEWVRATLENPNCALAAKFSEVHKFLHAVDVDAAIRQRIFEQVQVTNRIQQLCDGAIQIPESAIDWNSPLGKAINTLMSALYESLDLTIFRREGQTAQPTHQVYSEFIKKNKYVCPFCGIRLFKNKRGIRREDFDHYLHKSAYPLAAANLKNLVPTCGICNQDYKGTKDILMDGKAFYPYAPIPEIRVEVDCDAYPATENFGDAGTWSVTLAVDPPDDTAQPKLTAWNRVYSIKKRLEDEIREFFEEWMEEVSDSYLQAADPKEFTNLIASARDRANEAAKRRMQPTQIIKKAFYEFMLNRADTIFLESFRRLQNSRYA